MKECTPTAFPFEAHFSRRVEVHFGGTAMPTGGVLLLRPAEKKIRLLKRVAASFSDARAKPFGDAL